MFPVPEGWGAANIPSLILFRKIPSSAAYRLIHEHLERHTTAPMLQVHDVKHHGVGVFEDTKFIQVIGVHPKTDLVRHRLRHTEALYVLHGRELLHLTELGDALPKR